MKQVPVPSFPRTESEDAQSDRSDRGQVTGDGVTGDRVTGDRVTGGDRGQGDRVTGDRLCHA